MAQVHEAQLRLLYSLLKPVVRAAARFHIPMRTIAELARLAYFEHLQREGLSQIEIARRFGQTDRHMRSLAKRLKGDFFAAEQDVGVVREIENHIAFARPRPAEIPAKFPDSSPEEIDRAMKALVRDGRVELGADGRLQAPARYHILSSDQFHHRVDALNHFLDGMYRSVLHRLVFDDREEAMVKAISFTALPSSLKAFMTQFEGDLRTRIANLEEEAEFQGQTESRYTMGITLAPMDEQ